MTPGSPGVAERADLTTLRAIAILEAAKGLLVLAAGSGLFLAVSHDAQAFADRAVAHLHLDPASKYPRIFYRLVTTVSHQELRLLALGALAYALFRLAEAYGLWRARRWAEWLGVGSGLIYVPFELVAIARHPGWEPAAALLLSLGIVAFLGHRLRSDRRHAARRRSA